MGSSSNFLDPWPGPDKLWADPPWKLSGTSVTAWYHSDIKTVQKIVSPSFIPTPNKDGVITRIRFYQVNFEPSEGDKQFKEKYSGKFDEAVIAFKGSVAGIEGEYSAFMWTEDDAYMTWGREVFGWPLTRSKIVHTGIHWGDATSSISTSTILGRDFDFKVSVDSSPGVEAPISGGAKWLTPRRILFPFNQEPERRDLLVVSPTIIKPGNFYHHQGAVQFNAQPTSIISGLEPLGDCVIHRHTNFEIQVGDRVETIRG